MATQCNDIETLLPTYLDGELSPHDQISFDHHVADCSGCRDRMRSEGAYLARVRELLTPPPAPEELLVRVRLVLDQEDGQTRAARRRSFRVWALPGTASLAAAAALTLLVLTELRSPSLAEEDDEPDRIISHHEPLAAQLAGSIPVSTGGPSGGVVWRPMQVRFDVELGRRLYQLDLEVRSCVGLDLQNPSTQQGIPLWVTEGPVNTVVYRRGRDTCMVFASDMELGRLVQQVLRSGFIVP